MSLTAGAAPRLVGTSRPLASPILLAWLLGIALMALAYLPAALDTLRNGTLLDNDDAMRLVEVREWLGGQGWFDLRQARINPADSPLTHWSRLVDVPLAGGVAALTPLTGQDTAERIVTMAWPLTLAGLLLLVVLATIRVVLPPIALFLGAAIVGFNPVLLFDFVPGRIDHHGLQILLTAALCLATIEAVVRQRRWAAEAAGAAAALSVAIGLETLPFLALVCTVFGLAWVWEGAPQRRNAGRFGVTFGLGALALAALTVPVSRWGAPVCDAIGLPAVWLSMAGGGALALTGTMPQPARPAARLGAAVGLGLIAPAVFVWLWPACLAGPYSTVDPLVVRLWLSQVGEANPLLSVVREDPATFLFFLVFPLVGVAGLVVAAIREWRRQPAFIPLLAFALLGFALTLAQMRSAPFACIFAVPGWLYLIHAGLSASGQSPARRVASVGAGALLLAAALPFAWVALGVAAEGTSDAAPEPRCVARQDMAVLAAAAPGLVLAPIGIGPRILVATADQVLGAPYHRNNAGNRAALAGLTGEAVAARSLVADKGVRYVAICAGAVETARLTKAGGPDSLVAQLAAGATPQWLTPLPGSGPLRAWRVNDR